MINNQSTSKIIRGKRCKLFIEDIRHIPIETIENALCSLDNTVYLNSSDRASQERFSIIGFRPFLEVFSNGGSVSVKRRDQLVQLPGTLFDQLDKILEKLQPDVIAPAPFFSGAMGYVGYEDFDFGAESNRLLRKIKKEKQIESIADSWFGFFNQCVVIDHIREKQWFFVLDFGKELFEFDKLEAFKISPKYKSAPSFEKILGGIKSQKEDFLLTSDIQTLITKEDYFKNLESVQNEIKEGNTYQINYSYPSKATYTGHPFNLYLNLRQVSPAPFSAFIKVHRGFIASSSPECFLSITNGEIETWPIKGTAVRQETDSNRGTVFLENSEKDKAELTMIVDLERNDLGKICDIGTVDVPQQREIVSFTQVHHTQAIVKGRLKKELSAVQAFKHCFPGGSVTGAPKLSSMEIISKLEPFPRQVYTGAVGCFGFNPWSRFNIAIRTIYGNENELLFHTGGGIVSDSTAESEWQETLDKAAGMKEALLTKRNP